MSNQRLLLLQTHSGLHTGQPQAPDRLSRDAETGRPILRPASLMGALRKQMRDQLHAQHRDQPDWKAAAAEDPTLRALFGVRDDEDQPANLSASTGQLLFMPVRSLQGVYTWITSPAVLTSLAQNLATLDLSPFPALPNPHPFDAYCQTEHSGLLEGQHLLLEELSFQRKGELKGVLDWLLQDGLLGNLPIATELPGRLVLISDTAFEHFMRYAMMPYVRSSERGGHIQHIEMLPPNTWMYSLLNLDESLTWETNNLPGLVYLGSHRSTGHGLCSLNLVAPKSNVAVTDSETLESQPETTSEPDTVSEAVSAEELDAAAAALAAEAETVSTESAEEEAA